MGLTGLFERPAVFRLEDDLEARPFLLASGERYRDLLTITAARNVGEFGVIRSHEHSRPLKQSSQLHHSSHVAASPPKFHHTPALEVEPVYQTDREIFDFTDSRFIKPFPENLANYPWILRSSNDVSNLLAPPSSSHFQKGIKNDVQEVYTSFSPPVSHRPASEISLGSLESSQPSSTLASVLPSSPGHQVEGHGDLVHHTAVLHREELPGPGQGAATE